MPFDYTKPPMGVTKNIARYKDIRTLLKDSMSLQKELCVSNACSKICVILQQCLSAIGVQSRPVYGIMEFNTLDIKIPHVWLVIQNEVVDNTYQHIAMKNEEVFLELLSESRYIEKDPANDPDVFLGDDFSRGHGISDHNISITQWDVDNPDKSLAILQNAGHLRLYHERMRAIVLSKFHVTIPERPIVNESCWTCGLNTSELKTCSRCKVARYCSQRCQKDGWKRLYKNICIPPNDPRFYIDPENIANYTYDTTLY